MTLLATYYDPQLPTLLFSLHPAAAAAIENGTKVLEYRRRFYPRAFQALIYVTGPQGGVRLYVRCAPAFKRSPATLAELGHRVQGDQRADVMAYFDGTPVGMALAVTAQVAFKTVDLPTLRQQFPNFVTPRGYVFLDRPARQEQLAYLLAHPCSTGLRLTNAAARTTRILATIDGQALD